MVRKEIAELRKIGPLPDSQSVDDAKLEQQERLLGLILKPISDEEALILCDLFGPDDYYGMAWRLLHLIETAPGWPIRECLESDDNDWIILLRERAVRAGLI
ncbi:MAG: hypothetical protein EOP84_24550 [Verrucomicrobiaceae bacterium]|nr:MAG: hypothetical protein EOP84_24550 [Verrucomicrobiaceae bacterium]